MRMFEIFKKKRWKGRLLFETHCLHLILEHIYPKVGPSLGSFHAQSQTDGYQKPEFILNVWWKWDLRIFHIYSKYFDHKIYTNFKLFKNNPNSDVGIELYI